MSDAVKPIAYEIDGVQYFTMPHGPMAGLAVIDHMMALALGPLLSAAGGDGEELASLDSEAVVASLRSSGGLVVLAPMLLQFTTREQTLLSKEGIEMSYSRKYGELIRACLKVIEINNFFEVLSGLTESDLLSNLMQEPPKQ